MGPALGILGTLLVLLLLLFSCYLQDRYLFNSDKKHSVLKGYLVWLSNLGIPSKYRRK